MLKWYNQWGRQLDFLLELSADGEDVPALRSKPTLTIWQEQFWDAFQVLSDSRSFTQIGISSIPISEILAYLNLMQIVDAELRCLYLTFIRNLDVVFCNHINKKT